MINDIAYENISTHKYEKSVAVLATVLDNVKMLSKLDSSD